MFVACRIFYTQPLQQRIRWRPEQDSELRNLSEAEQDLKELKGQVAGWTNNRNANSVFASATEPDSEEDDNNRVKLESSCSLNHAQEHDNLEKLFSLLDSAQI
ncbi:hypothetical protein RRG08_027027 [Elysia crispata]|uniref:Uncharacterized protein n=1 Tax=Elysia crispata TaxID=231223 RepID=A0AAE1DZ39_9GAST|nr:hypothetical protein RRG08_027027 [Elysia crispata]